MNTPYINVGYVKKYGIQFYFTYEIAYGFDDIDNRYKIHKILKQRLPLDIPILMVMKDEKIGGFTWDTMNIDEHIPQEILPILRTIDPLNSGDDVSWILVYL